MSRPVLKKTIQALELLDKIHPKFPSRTYTVWEAAKKYDVPLTTIYRHLKKKQELSDQTKGE